MTYVTLPNTPPPPSAIYRYVEDVAKPYEKKLTTSSLTTLYTVENKIEKDVAINKHGVPFYQTPLSNHGLSKSYKTGNHMAIDIEIAKSVELLGYKTANITETTFNEIGITFRVFTVALEGEITDYNLLLKQEIAISQKLGLYDKNIVLELI